MTEYTIQGRGLDFSRDRWCGLSCAAGVRVPYMTTAEEAAEIMRKIMDKGKKDGIEYRIVRREVTPWQEV
jgi:hypothetical protein